MAASMFGIQSFLDVYTAGGLLDDISIILVYYALINQMYYFLDPLYILKSCRRSCSFKVTHRDGEKYLPNFTQLQAENLYEGSKMDLTYHAHDTLFVFWVSMFYLPALPFGIVASIFAFYTNFLYLKLKMLSIH